MIFKLSSQTNLLSILILSTILSLYINGKDVDCAPTSNNNGNNNKNGSGNNNSILNLRSGFLSNLFRRQTNSGNSASASTPPSITTTTESSNNESETDDPQTQTELEAQKFMDSLPNVGSNNSGPTTFRERVSDTFGLLREGMSNHFRSVRENFSDTVEDLRDTWSNSNSNE